MKMILHEAIRMNFPRGFGTGLAERFDETTAVQLVLEDGFAAIAAIHDVVDGAGVFDAEFAGHAGHGCGTPPKPSTQKHMDLRD
jgi:hypothetical protein